MDVVKAHAFSLEGLVILFESQAEEFRFETSRIQCKLFHMTAPSLNHKAKAPPLVFGYNSKVPDNNHRVIQTMLSVKRCHHYRQILKLRFIFVTPKLW